MAEYYPLLAKAVGSLPNSTLESRRVVYERARKALIGQLRTLHPPVPEDDIERESVELDRAVERLESELANGGLPPPPPQAAGAVPPVPAAKPTPPPMLPPRLPVRPAPPETRGALDQKPPLSVRSKLPPLRDAAVPTVVGGRNLQEGTASSPPNVATSPLRRDGPPLPPMSRVESPPAPNEAQEAIASGQMAIDPATPPGDGPRTRLDVQRPIAPHAPTSDGSRRRMWIIPVGIGLVVAAVAVAAWELRDTRQTVARIKPAEQTASSENGKIAERVGGNPAARDGTQTAGNAPSTTPAKPAATDQAAAPGAPRNPEVPVAHRAALLVEAPDEPNKVKTFLGTVVWKLNNVNEGPSDNVGLAVQADIDLPDDKMKATVTFEKNTDSSLPASHTIKVNFAMQPGSLTGDVQQISVPQLRQEDSPSGEPLAGVTVPVVPNSFLVGLSPGNAETVNIKQLRDTQWIDIPMLLSNGRIAKLTFEKGDSGARDLNEAIAAWQKS